MSSFVRYVCYVHTTIQTIELYKTLNECELAYNHPSCQRQRSLTGIKFRINSQHFSRKDCAAENVIYSNIYHYIAFIDLNVKLNNISSV